MGLSDFNEDTCCCGFIKNLIIFFFFIIINVVVFYMVIKNPFNVNFGDSDGAIKMVICVMCLLFTGVISRIMCKKQNDDDDDVQSFYNGYNSYNSFGTYDNDIRYMKI